MAKFPEDRFGSASELVAALEPYSRSRKALERAKDSRSAATTLMSATQDAGAASRDDTSAADNDEINFELPSSIFAAMAEPPATASDHSEPDQTEPLAVSCSFTAPPPLHMGVIPDPAAASRRSPPPARRKVILAAVAAIMVLLGGIIIKITNKNGTVTEIKVPDGATVEIVKEVGKPAPTNVSTPAPQPAAVDPHRRAAEAVLRLGGSVQYKLAGLFPGKVCSRIDDLPDDTFVLHSIDLRNSPNLTDETLPDLAGVHYLANGLNLDFAKLTSVGLAKFDHVVFPGCLLSGVRLTAEGFDRLAVRPDQKSLNLPAFEQPIDGPLGKSLRLHFPNLQVLNLQGTPTTNLLTPEGAREMAQWTSLDNLLAVRTTTAGLAELAALPNLRHLNLQGSTELGDDCVDVLGRFPALKSVGLYRTRITEAGARRLQELLPLASVHHPGLPTRAEEHDALTWILQQRGTVLGWKDGQFGQAVTEVPSGNFSAQKVDFQAADGPSSVAEHLVPLRGLERLSWTGLKNADEQAEQLSQLTGLSDIYLPDTDLTDAGLSRLTALTSLQGLIIIRSLITDKGMEHLVVFSQLHYLSVGELSVTDDGIRPISQLPLLGTLLLHSCKMLTSDGLRHLTELKLLRVLDLRWTPIDDAAIPHLKQMTNLRELLITHTNITPAGVAELQQALPQCVIHYGNKWLIPPIMVSDPVTPSQPATTTGATSAPPTVDAPDRQRPQ